jgi:hypothetical protein
MYTRASAAVYVLGALMGTFIQSTTAFTFFVSRKGGSMRIQSKNHKTKLRMSSFFADATPAKEIAVAVQRDVNGNAITSGQKVAIATHNSISAHHVAKSSYGSFNPTTKQFLPQDESNITRKTSCLLLPEGLQGEVITVYDTNSCDRAHPILVKFGSDEDRNDGYTLDSAFTMYLGPNEIMVVA